VPAEDTMAKGGTQVAFFKMHEVLAQSATMYGNHTLRYTWPGLLVSITGRGWVGTPHHVHSTTQGDGAFE
jgi:hypothetical protein